MRGTRKHLGLWIAVLVLLALAAPVQRAMAHAEVIEAEPSRNAELEVSPSEVRLRFSEPIAPDFSGIQVLDVTGQRVDSGDATLEFPSADTMVIALPSLENGTYTVSWQNLSTVDGHRRSGAYVFSVGEPISGGAPGQEERPPVIQSPLDPITRWWVLTSVLALFAGPAFWVLVVRPVAVDRSISRQAREAAARLLPRMRLLVWAAGASFVLASVLQLTLQAGLAQGGGLTDGLGSPMVSVLTATTWGYWWAWRVGLFLAMLAVVYAEQRLGQRRPVLGAWLPRGALALGAGGLLTVSLSSHAAAALSVRSSAVSADFLHLLGAGVWVGGLPYLALVAHEVLRGMGPAERRAVLGGTVPRFSFLALLSAGVLAITGAYSGWVHVTSVRAVDTPYGLTLVSKTLLVLLLLGLGAFNLLWVRPRLRSGVEGAGAWLRRMVLAEVAVGVLVLVAVGVMTSMEPARQAAGREMEGPSFEATAEGADIVVSVEPGTTGPNRVEVLLRDALGRAIENADAVEVSLRHVELGVSVDAVPARHEGDGVYAAEGVLLSVAGEWQVDLVVRRPDAFDARTAFRFDAPAAAAGGGAVIPLDADLGRLLWGVALLLIGIVAAGAGLPVGGWGSTKGASTMGIGTAVAVVGLFIIGTSPMLGGEAPARTNPFPPTAESLAAGEATYVEHCAACHGSEGRGDGPLAGDLQPPPADLREHVPYHPDWEILGFVQNGVPGTAMPAFRDTLTEDDIWHLVNYLRVLVGEQGGA